MSLQELNFPESVRTAGLGGAVGFLVGFTLKRAFRMFIVFLGIYLLSLLWLSDLGLIAVRWSEMDRFLGEVLTSISELAGWLVRTLPFTGSFLAGFLLGLKL
ncbi:MAG: FUN14 domain-containing protein [Aquificota bacterium]|nr:FUN14 domain-containing protein [Aquificota bacterium]